MTHRCVHLTVDGDGNGLGVVRLLRRRAVDLIALDGLVRDAGGHVVVFGSLAAGREHVPAAAAPLVCWIVSEKTMSCEGRGRRNGGVGGTNTASAPKGKGTRVPLAGWLAWLLIPRVPLVVLVILDALRAGFGRAGGGAVSLVGDGVTLAATTLAIAIGALAIMVLAVAGVVVSGVPSLGTFE